MTKGGEKDVDTCHYCAGKPLTYEHSTEVYGKWA